MDIDQHKSPGDCCDMSDIRAEIDRLDRAVIALLGQRFKYVQAASKFKTSAAAVRAPERFTAMLQQRREWAIEEQLNPDAIEKLYSDLVKHFIAEELQQWQQEQQSN
ncbi:MAG: isochorismate lyase [Pseudomonas sp.]|uniref:isochorismate lyase n=1 Tax=Pseudomonas sp. TaxID=306 RepID=UPI003BB5912C